MAILTDVPGLTVTIEVDGEELTEYDDDDNDEPAPLARTSYVEAASGAKFCIVMKYDRFAFPHKGVHISYRIYLDGTWVSTGYHSPAQISRGDRFWIDGIKKDLGDRYVKQKFSFAELNIVEGSEDIKLWGKLTALGTISVKFFKVQREKIPLTPSARGRGQSASKQTMTTPPPAQQRNQLKTALLENGEVPEKNLKGSAVSHQAKLLFAEEIPYNPAIEHAKNKIKKKTKLLDPNPIVAFQFKYRSRAALQALQIIEHTPPPVPLEERPVDELTPAELKQLVARQKEQLLMKSEDVKIKREKRDRSNMEQDGDDDFEIIETNPAERKKKQQKNSQIIDISDDE